jgi:lysine biosynthesis protein LysW
VNTSTQKSISATCPGCENEIFFNKMPEPGQFVTCQNCGDMLEVIETNPLILYWSDDEEEDEDWGEDGDS